MEPEDNVSPHPYGFPEEWYRRVEYGPHSATIAYKCFDLPDYEKMSTKLLNDEKLFKRLILSLRDLNHASSALTFVAEDVDFDAKYGLAELRRFMCYETTAIISYARPFSQSYSDIPSLAYGKLGIKLSPFTRALHDKLIAKRNAIFAHTDPDEVLHSHPHAMTHTRPDGSRFSTLMPPRFIEGTMLESDEFEQMRLLVSSLTVAVYSMAQAMHQNFGHLYPGLQLKIDDSEI